MRCALRVFESFKTDWLVESRGYGYRLRMATLAEELDQILKGGNQPSTITVDATGLKEWATKQVAAAKSDTSAEVQSARLLHMKQQLAAGVEALASKQTFDLIDFDPAAQARKAQTLDELGKLSAQIDVAASKPPVTTKTEPTAGANAAAAAPSLAPNAPAGTEADAGAGANASGASGDTPAADDKDTDAADVEKGWELASDDDPFPGDMRQLKFDRQSGQLLRRKSVTFG